MAYVCVCDRCEGEFHIQGVFSSDGADYWMYRLASGVRFPLLKAHGWCTECDTVCQHEVIPGAREISAQLESLDQARRDFSAGKAYPFGESRAAIALEAERNQGVWRDWAQTRTAPRCLTCGSTEIAPSTRLDAPADGLALELFHPGCGGHLVIRHREDDIRISPNRYSVRSQHFFVEADTTGLPVGRTLERRIDWLDREQPGLSDYLCESLELYKLQGTLMPLTHARYGDAARRQALQGCLEQFIVSVLTQTPVRGIDPQSFPGLFPDIHWRAAIVIRALLVSSGITQPVPRCPEGTSPVPPSASGTPGTVAGGRLPGTLASNPFHVLGLTARASRATIVGRADEMSLHQDAAQCQKARSDLTHPRSRLSAEVAWFPGLSPRRIDSCLMQLSLEPRSVVDLTGIPDLAWTNLLCAAVELVEDPPDEDLPVSLITALINQAKEVKAEEVFNDINADRLIAGFPDIKSLEPVESELVERRRYYRKPITDTLNRLDSELLLEVINLVTIHCLKEPDDDVSDLLYEVVDAYCLETLSVLEDKAQDIERLMTVVRSHARTAGKPLDDSIAALSSAVFGWDEIATPIQLTMERRGLVHEPSKVMTGQLRSLSLFLFNECQQLEQARQINWTILQAFHELAEVKLWALDDAQALTDLAKQSEERRQNEAQWAQKIQFDAELGVVFKDRLQLNVHGLTWKDKTYPLASITRARWGGVRHSVNGIPIGTDYTVAFGDARSESQLLMKRESVYTEFTSKLWMAVAAQIMNAMLASFKQGQSLRFGEALVSDDGVVLIRRKFLCANQEQKLRWSQVRIWSQSGSLVIGAQDDKKLYAPLSYIDVSNVHFLEHLLRLNFKKPGASLLSQTFDRT